MPKSVVHQEYLFDFEVSLDRMWKQINPDVMYDPDIDIERVTSDYNLRYYKPSVTNNNTNTIGEHMRTNRSYNDLRSEASA